MNQPVRHHVFEGARPHVITADEFWQMIDLDIFSSRRVELVEGELVEMAPSNMPHGELIVRLSALISNAYGSDDWRFFADCYVGLSSVSVRAPDLTVISRRVETGRILTAADVTLALEVSHSTLTEDMGRKRRNYAEAGIANYWVFDIDGRQVHMFAQPEGDSYAVVREAGFDDALALPGIDGTIVIG